jgi:hypothetical protein
MSSDRLDRLYIGDVNRIRLPINHPDTGVPQTGATVTFSVRTAEAPGAGTVVGTANQSMTFNTQLSEYVGTWAASESDDMTEDTHYWVHITASGYTLRIVECVAKYRGRV